MGSFKDAVIPPYDLRVIAETVVEEFGLFPSRSRVLYALDQWMITPDDMDFAVYEALVTAVTAVAALTSVDPGV